MRKFRLHWLGGKTEECEGTDIANAFSNAGYGGGANRALDYWEEIKPHTVVLAPKDSMDDKVQMTFNQLFQACENFGIDLKCGACASIFFTGVADNPHEEDCHTRR